MNDFSAIRPGTDLPSHARELVRMHDAVIGGGKPRMRPRGVVARSWTRVLEGGLDPGHRSLRNPLPFDEVLRRRRESPLSLVIDELRQILCSVADASQFLMVVTDADGVILWREGSARVRSRADALAFAEGAEWTEAHVGTNAIGTALAEAAPVQLFSAEHFEQQQHPWYCTAAPMHDPRTGALIGIIDISGPALTLHPAILALVETAVRLEEGQLRRHHELRLERLRTAATPTLTSVAGPLLLVDEHGWVAHTVGVAPRDRIAVPSADQPLTVPGLGLCLPEPLADGWLVRPSGQDRRIVLTLDLSTTPCIEVSGCHRQWRSSVTARHAEILTLLHRAGPAGLSAVALSRALHGDADHLITVRAEVSRLRRKLGGIVESRPYRIAPGVEMTVVDRPSLAAR
ncbi:transcriptional regulator [Pseudonocardia sp.]|uniref:transcriptional regulator n=1 Tax=Pseudonocardia sp. TaxID=60912 RepID=UPI003D14A22B